MSDRIRALREELGWSQAELADRAGVSRQLVGAVERGLHRPNVDAALALARALGCSVEELFAPSPDEPVPVFGTELPPAGSPLTVARVGEQLVVIPMAGGASSPEQWALADATLSPSGGLEMLVDGYQDGVVIAGCDPALGLLATLVERRSPHRILVTPASTGRSLEALASGRVHGILVHGPTKQLPKPPVPVERWHLACWQVGVASGRTSGVPSVEEIAERRLRVVQRDGGAGVQAAFTRALARVGAPSQLPGPIADGHLDAARRVAAGAVAGLTIEAAARSFGLRFTPLEEHAVEVWIDQRWGTLPAVTELLATMSGRSLRDRLGLIGGYDLSSCGQRIVR
ncbi:MAG: helix-turn-helix domain-containing protein [Acidimicrobiales bacterium]|nr:helix-turn-helix domain-containing protein [Acidimicrobiales bacterium]